MGAVGFPGVESKNASKFLHCTGDSPHIILWPKMPIEPPTVAEVDLRALAHHNLSANLFIYEFIVCVWYVCVHM